MGYLITGVKDVRQSKVGDTVTTARHGATEPLTGYREPKPMVYSGLYPVDGSEYPRCAMRWTGYSSTTPRSPTNRKPRWRSVSDSAAAFWDCCTWRSPASGWNANSTST
ncbi:elongation factor 4 domain protein [Mycobacterium xenopi 3993]|nr:elongation factor 4 domain protein [Mycobacterium xenopi 3993]